MDKGTEVLIIGAGIGGIATAAILAHRGYKVTIIEKNAYPGGRCGSFVKDGHRFDTGATFLMMPGVYENIFSAIGKNLDEEMTLYRLDPLYKIKYPGNKEILFTSNLASLQKQLEALEGGSYGKFLKLMRKGFWVYKDSMRLINRNYYSLLDPSLLKYPFLLYRYKAFSNHYKYISRFFKSTELRTLFTFQNLYLGQNPFTGSGLYFFLPFMELADGVLFPKGGMHKIADSLLSEAARHDAKVLLNSPVAEIKVDGNRANGVVLEDGTKYKADIIVANADLPYVYKQLLPGNGQSRRFNKMKYSCSAVAFHWGVDKIFPQLQHHTVFVSSKHRESCKSIFRDRVFPEEPSIYVHSPVRTDKSAAPENQDSITAIVHTGNIDDQANYDWEKVKKQARDVILNRFEEEGMTDFEKHIKFEICYTPGSWKSEFNLTRGGTFGSLGHNILQMGFLRPSNQHKKYRNLYFVGGSTQPGSGMPLALTSAKLVTERIEKTYRKH